MPEGRKVIELHTLSGNWEGFDGTFEDWQKIKRAMWNRQRFSLVTEEHGEFFFILVTHAKYRHREMPDLPRIRDVLLPRAEP